MLPILAFLTLVMLLTSFLPLSHNPHWLVRGMEFPRLQFAILATFLLLAHFSFLDMTTIAAQSLTLATILCLAWQLWWILPYTILWRKEVKDSENKNPNRQISILTANVLTPNRNVEALIALVRKHQPDVLVTLETDKWWENELKSLEGDMPYSVKCPLDNLYGMHVYSRLPLHDQEICFLVEDDVPSIHAALELRTGDIIRAHFLHPAPPSPSENTESTERDAELVIVARSIAKSDQPVIVAGDLNDVAWSATTRLFRKISGLLDPRVGRGVFNTFHADHFLVRWPLDHLFHSEHFTLQDIERLPSIGSDHFPLLTKLAFTPALEAQQERLDVCAPDREWAQEITDAQKVQTNEVPNPGEIN